MQTTNFDISHIKNTNQAAAIKDSLATLMGVANVSIDPDSNQVRVTYDSNQVDISKLENAIANRPQ